jgi:glycosyltransferase involved in cell wall biosynthesis
MRTVRVALLVGWYYPDSVGGTESYVRSLAKELRAMGVSVSIAAPSDDEKEYEYQFDDLPVYRYPVSRTPSRTEIAGDSAPQYFDAFAKWIQAQRFDLVHMHSVTRGVGLYHARYIKSCGIPLVVTVHVPGVTCARETMMRWGRVPCDGEMKARRCSACCLQGKGLPFPLAWMITAIPTAATEWSAALTSSVSTMLQMPKVLRDRAAHVREIFGVADRVVAVSRWLYDVLLRNGVQTQKLLMIPHGIVAQVTVRSHARRTADKLRVGYVGRFSPIKGVHVLVSALRRLPRSVAIELYLFGTARGDEAREYLVSLQKLAESDPRVRFCGELTDSNRHEVFASFHILAVPSLCLETGPLVVLEAFDAGLPVIGSDAGGIRELVKDSDNGVLVKPGNTHAWALALNELQKRWVKGEWSWKIPQPRTSRQVAVETVLVYEQVLKQHDACLAAVP